MKPQSDAELLAAARSLAKPYGLFITEKSGKFHVFRKTAPRPTHLGFRHSPADLLHWVERLVRAK